MTAPKNALAAGHDLDRAVALATGWRDEGTDARTGRRWFVRGGVHQVMPRYSADHAALPEMLAWLSSHVNLGLVQNVIEWRAFDRDDVYDHCIGDTLPEAVARLVCAVAGRQRE